MIPTPTPPRRGPPAIETIVRWVVTLYVGIYMIKIVSGRYEIFVTALATAHDAHVRAEDFVRSMCSHDDPRHHVHEVDCGMHMAILETSIFRAAWRELLTKTHSCIEFPCTDLIVTWTGLVFGIMCLVALVLVNKFRADQKKDD